MLDRTASSVFDDPDPLDDEAIAAREAAESQSYRDEYYGTIRDMQNGLLDPYGRGLRVIEASRLAGRPVPPREWIVEGMIPDRNVTLLYGDGGDGKSLLALQLAVAMATGTDWLNTLPEQGPVVYLSAEDDLDEVHRRLADICAARSIDMAMLGDLYVIPLAGRDAVLAELNPQTNRLVETKLLKTVRDTVLMPIIPKLVIIDTLADTFGGNNESDRNQARQFITTLRGIGRAVLVLAHPSLTGMNSGTGTSGSTGWSNSVRSRLYMSRVKGGDGAEADPNMRSLKVMKSNYGTIGSEVRMRWEAGRFKLVTGLSEYDHGAAERAVEELFLKLLAKANATGRHVGANPGANYAPKRFAEHADANGTTARAFARAMERLLEAGRIRVEESGPASRRRSKLVEAGGF